MKRDPALEDLWQTACEPGPPFGAADVAGLPEPTRRYLTHAIAEGTPLESAVRLRMNGELKLGGGWNPFAADQVIRWRRGFVWQARVKMEGLPRDFRDKRIEGKRGRCDAHGGDGDVARA